MTSHLDAVQLMGDEHAAVRVAGGEVAKAVEAVGFESLASDGAQLLVAYDDFARSLAQTFRELEGEIFGPVRNLTAQGRLLPGVLASSKPRLEELESKLRRHGGVLAGLELRFESVPVELAVPLRAFVEAVRVCLRGHRDALLPTLMPYFQTASYAN